MPNAPAYQPDDARISVQALVFLHGPQGRALRQAIAALPAHGQNPDVAQIAALRKSYPADAVHAALALARIQPKAAGPRGKFPHLPYVWATPEALEQATHIDVARQKAQRLVDLGARQIFDLCAGIGGDALALAEKMPVTTVELSPVRAQCLAFNAEEAAATGIIGHPLTLRTADLQQVLPELPADAWVHIDPARRTGGKRSPHFADLIPGPELLQQVFAGGRHGAIKLSPAVDFDTLPPGHLEIISHQGTVVQALLWLNTELPLGQHTVSVLGRSGTAFTLTGHPGTVEIAAAPVTTELGAEHCMLYEVDGAITRAGLAHQLATAHHLAALTMDGGYLLATGSAGGTALAEIPAHVLRPFEIWGIVPLARIADALEQLPIREPGAVEVKARGRLPGIETDRLQVKWSKQRNGACTVLLFRQNDQTLAAVGYRVTAAEA